MLKKNKLHTTFLGILLQTIAKKGDHLEVQDRPEDTITIATTEAIRSEEPGARISIPRTGIRRLGGLLRGATSRIKMIFRTGAMISSYATKTARGGRTLTDGGSIASLRNGWTRSMHSTKSTKHNFNSYQNGMEVSFRHHTQQGLFKTKQDSPPRMRNSLTAVTFALGLPLVMSPKEDAACWNWA